MTEPTITAPPSLTGEEYITFVLDENFDMYFSISSFVFWLLVGVVFLIFIVRAAGSYRGFGGWKSFEIDEAQFGLGKQKLTLRPNQTDRQIAYKIWVELSTRKIGLPIDLNDDVIVEIYDSWYNFFGVTRELIKDVPVSKFRRKDTEKIIKLSIEVLNQGMRPHLTKWQARFRRWYDTALQREDNVDFFPQDIQRQFPDFETLAKELEEVNCRLIRYREKMYQLVTNL